jgi:S-DNA-T family DNA segregation ATPase FtsK/SpoIIIE
MEQALHWQSDRIETVLEHHRLPARVTGGTITPRWIRFQVLPTMGAKISKIRNLSEELAAALDVPTCRVSRRGAAVAIEIPRDDPQPVRLLPLLTQLTTQDIPPLAATLGLAEDGAPLVIRLPSPDVAHILVAGTTGSGKTVLLQSMILSLAMHNRPAGLALVLIDPKSNAFSPFEGLPHLARTIISETDDATATLHTLLELLTDHRHRPTIAVVIDEIADLLITGGKTFQLALTRLTQRGREAGIHIVAATQKPTAAVLGPLVKANFPVRLCGKVTCIEDARVATGWSGTGAERLMGRGDFLAVAEGQVTHFQSAHVSKDEIARIVGGLPGNRGYVLSLPAEAQAVPVPPTLKDPVTALATQLIQSDIWQTRHGDSYGTYRRGFLSAACQLLFNQPPAGSHYHKTIAVIQHAEQLYQPPDNTPLQPVPGWPPTPEELA